MVEITDNTVEYIITRFIIILVTAEIIHKDLKMIMVIETSQTIITEIETAIMCMLQMIRKTPTIP